MQDILTYICFLQVHRVFWKSWTSSDHCCNLKPTHNLHAQSLQNAYTTLFHNLCRVSAQGNRDHIPYGLILCHLRFQCMNFSLRKLKASLHRKDMTQLPIIASFYVIAETVLSAKTADADYYSTGKFYICRKNPGWSSLDTLACCFCRHSCEL